MKLSAFSASEDDGLHSHVMYRTECCFRRHILMPAGVFIFGSTFAMLS